MISVCVVTYNGEKYIKNQIDSILNQLGNSDEIIVSDDGSTDCTLDILNTYLDDRIKIFNHDKTVQKYNIDYVSNNVSFALSKCSGDYIFLADQDDVWLPTKLERMMLYLVESDIVMSDCKIVDSNLEVIYDSYFSVAHTRVGIVKNIIKNSYLGCCMAFRRKILDKVLPFPPTGVGHDLWIGLVGALYYKTILVKEPLLLYRKHENNVTPTMKSMNPISFRFYYRILIVIALLKKILGKM